MKTLLFVCSFLLFGLTLSAQEEQRSLPPGHEEVKDLSTLIKPELIDSFFMAYKRADFRKIESMTDSLNWRYQSRKDFRLYYAEITRVYGKLGSYKAIKYTTRPNHLANNKLIDGVFEVSYPKFKGKIHATFSIQRPDSINMYSFQIFMNDYTVVPEFRNYYEPVFKEIQAKNSPAVYQLCSPDFRKRNTAENFSERLKPIFDAKITSYKLLAHQITVTKGNPNYALLFVVNDGNNFIRMNFIKRQDGTFLESIDYEQQEY